MEQVHLVEVVVGALLALLSFFLGKRHARKNPNGSKRKE